MSKVVVVTAGHSNKDSGAVANTDYESVLMTDLRNLVVYYLTQAKVKVLIDGVGVINLPLTEAIKLIRGAAVAVELHCNASTNKSARGVEVLAQAKDKKLSQDISSAIATVLGTVVRGDGGWKSESSGQHSRLAYVSNGGLIVEVFFISNPVELQAYKQKKWLVAKAIATVILNYIK